MSPTDSDRRTSPRKKQKIEAEDGTIKENKPVAKPNPKPIKESQPVTKPKDKESKPAATPKVKPTKESKPAATPKVKSTKERKPAATPKEEPTEEIKPMASPKPPVSDRQMILRGVAAETRNLLPGLLATRPDVEPRGVRYDENNLQKLDPKDCPKYPPTKIRVINSDTIDAALDLRKFLPRPVCVLNMANATSAGGGWEHGSLAQEEALCFRTSLSFTLKLRYYPLPDEGGIYSPRVLVIRDSMKNGHGLLDFREPSKLPYIAVVSVAAICRPKTITDRAGLKRYSIGEEKTLMEEKIRVVLRICAVNKHPEIVLGALGCGVFGNPREEVAKMFLSILKEPEFRGYFTRIVFAVLDDGRGNFQAFSKYLDGQLV